MVSLIVTILVGIVITINISVLVNFVNVWMISRVNGLNDVTISNLIGMKLRKIPPEVIINSLIILRKAGFRQIEPIQLESHYLAGGDLDRVVETLVREQKSGKNPDFISACADDLRNKYEERSG